MSTLTLWYTGVGRANRKLQRISGDADQVQKGGCGSKYFEVGLKGKGFF